MLGVMLMDRFVVVALVTSRLGGFLLTSPFPGDWAPPKARITLALALGLPVALALPSITGSDVSLGLDPRLVLTAISEIALGAAIGFAFRLVVGAADYMAAMVAQVSWLSVPTSMSVDGGGQSQALAQVSSLLAVLVALSIGAHRIVIGYLLASFEALPAGAPMMLGAGAQTLVPLAGRCLDMGMRLAVPVFGISLGVQGALALVARVAPSLQIFNVGFAVLVASGMVTFAASLRAISQQLARFIGGLPGILDELLTLVAGG